MKVLVIGSGGREHAIAWKLLQSDRVERVFVAPGNGGTALMPGCENVPVAVKDFAEIHRVTTELGIDLVAVGPEDPLALGIVDFLQGCGVPVFGPSKAGALMEASKAWAKALMAEAGISTARSQTFTADREAEALAYLEAEGAPIVVKADGLAAGKGVVVASDLETAREAAIAFFRGKLGQAGAQVVIEECLTGQEASVLALTDGITIRPLLPAQDHKPIGEGDTGANTGGMGAYAPTPVVPDPMLHQIQQEVLEPAIAALQQRGIDYRGVLYAGLMISATGDLRVLEFNCRFGDPETQAVLPLLETPLEELMLACIEQRLAEQPPIRWRSGSAACVVLASGGYPGSYETGKEISGLSEVATTGAIAFHAGTKLEGDRLVTSGGRVLGVTGLGETLKQALDTAYTAIDRIHFNGQYARRDIGYRVL